MGASTAFQTALLDLLLQNTALADIGTTAGLQPSSSAGDLYIALHTADPTVSGNQSSSEATYTGYARVGVERSAGGWTISGGDFSNDAVITFGACTAGSSTVTFFSIGTLVTGTGMILVSGALTTSLAITSGITPSFAAGALTGTVS